MKDRDGNHQRDMSSEDVGEMLFVAKTARDSGFKSVEIDTEQLIEALELAWSYARLCES